jgi:protein SCO1/2
MRSLFILIFISLVFASCKSVSTESNSSDAKRYPFKGKVVSVDKAKKTATIDHDEIPGFMSGMTMAFPIHEDWVWDELTPGSEIQAELVVDNKAKDPYWLEKVGIVSAPNPNLPTPTPDNRIGKEIPDFTLTNQDGKRISAKDFRGKAWALTFIYARCPLPDYCIRMSTHFSDLANQLKQDTDLKDKIRLLSISFDPDNDTPAKLKQYGAGYLGNQNPSDFSIWQLAVGSDAEVKPLANFFGLDYRTDENNKAVINHNLRTAVVSPDGKVTKIFNGNEWTTGELLNELKATLR